MNWHGAFAKLRFMNCCVAWTSGVAAMRWLQKARRGEASTEGIYKAMQLYAAENQLGEGTAEWVWTVLKEAQQKAESAAAEREAHDLLQMTQQRWAERERARQQAVGGEHARRRLEHARRRLEHARREVLVQRAELAPSSARRFLVAFSENPGSCRRSFGSRVTETD